MDGAKGILFYILLGVLLAFLLNFGGGFLLGTSIPIVAVESNSMVPAFEQGDILIVQGVPAEQLNISDIIVFSVPQQSTPIVHRIIEINKDGTFQTKGDANNGQLSFEKNILKENIHGKVIFIIPKLGWIKILAVAYLWPNILWIILAIIILIFIYLLIQRKLM